MLSKSVLAAAALASTLVLGTVGAAKADPTITFGIGIGDDPWFYGHHHHGEHFMPPPPPSPSYGFEDAGFGPPPGEPSFYPRHHDYRISCGEGANAVRARGFHGVRPVDCSAPVYEYRGWKYGQPYSIEVSMRGRVVGVSPTDW